MKKLDYYAWYPGDFRKDTQHLTPDERHAFRDLLDEIFLAHQDTCSIPDDDAHLARVVGRALDEWKSMRYALLDGPRPLLKKSRGRIGSERLTQEIEKAKDLSKTRSVARRSKSSTNVEQVPALDEQVKPEVEEEEPELDSSAPPSQKKMFKNAREAIEGFKPGEAEYAWASEHAPSVPVVVETGRWIDRCRTNGFRTRQGPIKDAAASWRTAMSNAEEWGTYARKSSAPAALRMAETAKETHSWFDANVGRIREFVGSSEAFTREFGFSGEDWNSYLRAYQSDLSVGSLPVSEWLEKRGAA